MLTRRTVHKFAGGAAPLPHLFCFSTLPWRLLCFLVVSTLFLTFSCGAQNPYEDEEHNSEWMLWMLNHHEWHPWEYDYYYRLVDAVKDASDATGVSAEAIVATLTQESGMRHYKKDGKVQRGDWSAKYQVWMARGVAQIHQSPWCRHFTKELGRDIDLDDLHDNVEVCARLLLRGGWDTNPLEAYGYYNSGQRGFVNRYARSVASIEKDILLYKENEDGI